MPAATAFNAAMTLPDLTDAEFHAISDLVYRTSGINLPPGKQGLVRSRLSRRLRELGLTNFDAYLVHVRRDRAGGELARMVDALTTNKTEFFREIEHFRYLRDRVLPTLTARRRRVRIWSAACSTGEEPYSIAMVLRDELPDATRVDARILATDISARVLAHARRGVYPESALKSVPPDVVRKHFTCVQYQSPRSYRVTDDSRALVHFARLNLMDPWPMHGPFDVIFCRNVMIYFDKATQQQLITRLSELLSPGGYLFVGHSESISSLSHDLRYVRPAVYAK